MFLLNLCQGAGNLISLDDPTAGHEIGVFVAHAILVGRGAHQGGQPECHVVSKVEGIIQGKQVFQCVGRAQVKRVK